MSLSCPVVCLVLRRVTLVACNESAHHHRSLQGLLLFTAYRAVFVSPCACAPASLLAAYSGLESESYSELSELSNHMGLFLQKTNIIRDYLVGGRGAGRA